MPTDWFNALLVMGGMYLAAANAIALHRDKKVRGVYWKAWVFYSFCAVWDIYYYKSVGHPWSVAAAVLLSVATIAWLAMAFRYRKN